MAQLTGRAHGFANFRKRAKQNTDSFIATDSISCMLNLDSDWKASSIPLQLKKSPFMLAVDISYPVPISDAEITLEEGLAPARSFSAFCRPNAPSSVYIT
jgi:hypothetical protein